MVKLKKVEDGFLLTVRLQPRASRTEICGPYEDALKIKVVSPPLDGRANKECIELLARFFETCKSNLKVVSGEKSRNKEILIRCVSCGKIQAALKDEGLEID